MDPLVLWKYYHIVLILILGIPGVRPAYDTTSAGNLQTALLTSYYTFLRPSSQTDVALGFGVSSINDLDIISQTLYLNGFLLVTWTDSRLAWTASSYGNMAYTMMKMSTIWVPPLVLTNAADGVKIISDDDNIANIPVKVFSSGMVVWILPANFKASCSVNIEYYPFDFQTCSITVSSWMYETGEVNITQDMSPEVNTDLYEVNGEWDWISSSVENGALSLHGHPHPTVQFNMKVQRKHSYYVLNMLLPVLILNYLGLCVFLLPSESGEKIGYSLTVLLSLSVVMTIVSDKIPTTSTHVCVLSVYLLTAFMLSALECAITVIVLRFHHLEEQGYKVSKKVQPHIRQVANLLRWKRGKDDGPEGNNNDNSDATAAKRAVTVLDIENKVHSESSTRDAGLCNGRPKNSAAWSKDPTSTSPYTYRDLGMIMDKLSFYVFGVITVIVTVVFMFVLTLGAS